MKKIFTLLCICCLGFGAMAQLPINLGVHGGISSNRIKFKDIPQAIGTQANTGYMVGAFMRVNLGKLYLEPALNYSHKKSVIEENDNENFQQTELVFQVPLLCLLPMNSLAVNEIKLNFGMEITSLSSYDAKLKTNLVERKAVLKGRISSGNNMGQKGNRNKKESTNLNVEITAGPLPLPKGVLSIIDLYTNAIQPRPVNKELQ